MFNAKRKIAVQCALDPMMFNQIASPFQLFRIILALIAQRIVLRRQYQRVRQSLQIFCQYRCKVRIFAVFFGPLIQNYIIFHFNTGQKVSGSIGFHGFVR